MSIFQEILQHLDAATDEWGIRVERVEVRVPLHSQIIKIIYIVSTRLWSILKESKNKKYRITRSWLLQ